LKEQRVPGLLVDVAKCPRCGLGHPRLGILPCLPDGPGRLRGGETHEAPCPERGWKIYFRVGREPKTGPTFRLVVDEIM
jgi:hypothetical protein